MCGRYVLDTELVLVAELFEALWEGSQASLWQPSFNIAPTSRVPILRPDPVTQKHTLDLCRWGLLTGGNHPGHGKGPLLFNARAETVAEKPSFADSFERRPCLVPLRGFYEWRGKGKSRQPFFMTLPNIAKDPGAGRLAAPKSAKDMITVAGIWAPPGDHSPKAGSVAILTTQACQSMAEIHDRMPVIVSPSNRQKWLFGTGPKGDRQKLLHALTDASQNTQLSVWPVDDRVGKASEEGAELLRKVRPKPLPVQQLSLF